MPSFCLWAPKSYIIRAVMVTGEGLAFRNNSGQSLSMHLSTYPKHMVPLLVYLEQRDGLVLLQKATLLRRAESGCESSPTSSGLSQSASHQ